MSMSEKWLLDFSRGQDLEGGVKHPRKNFFLPNPHLSPTHTLHQSQQFAIKALSLNRIMELSSDDGNRTLRAETFKTTSFNFVNWRRVWSASQRRSCLGRA